MDGPLFELIEALFGRLTGAFLYEYGDPWGEHVVTMFLVPDDTSELAELGIRWEE